MAYFLLSSRLRSVYRYRLYTRLGLFILCPLVLFLGFYIYDQYPPPYATERILSLAPASSPKVLQRLKDSDVKFVLFKQVRGAGFNNQLQEYLIHHALAKASGRAMVYQDVIWRYRGYDEVPLSAFSESLVQSPNVHEKVFYSVCGHSGERIMNVTIDVEYERLWETAEMVLRSEDARCVRVETWLFHWSFLESDYGVQLYPQVRSTLGGFTWSKRVYSAFDRASTRLGLSQNWDSVMATHLRRGDFSYHCAELAKNSHPFNLWNKHPSLPSSSDYEAPTAVSTSSKIYSHCYPSLNSVVSTIKGAMSSHRRRSTKPITRLHVLHSGAWDTPGTYLFLYRLRRRLMHSSPALSLQGISTTDDLGLKFVEKDFGVPVDMEIARQAAVFVGNGYSSLSSDVVGLRLADGKDPGSHFFW